jgi:hypothetical protein
MECIDGSGVLLPKLPAGRLVPLWDPCDGVVAGTPEELLEWRLSGSSVPLELYLHPQKSQ